MKEIFRKIEAKIQEYNSIIIFHHVRPDGDCLGSQFGLKELVKDNYKEKNVYAVGDDGGIFPFLNFKMDKIPKDEILQNSLGIVVDANYSNRIQNAELIMEKKIKEVIRIDHHPENDDLEASLVFKDDSYSASAEQIGDLALNLEWKISKKAAEYIYLGIVTDSGRFLFNKTSPRTFQISAKLLETNFDFDKFSLKLYERKLLDLKKQNIVLNNLKTKGNIIYFEANEKMMKENNIDEQIANFIYLISNIENYYVWIFFIEDKEENLIRIRLRSSGPNVNEVAKKFNGGGHFRASGAKINSFDEVSKVLEESQKAIDKWLKLGK